MAYFPMFIELKDCPCLVVGGGPVAWHKVCVLRDFGAEVTVVAKEICQESARMPEVHWRKKDYEKNDIHRMRLVVAATSDEEVNHRICTDCRTRGVPVNVVDKPEECDFIFPSYVKQKEVVAAFSSGGQSPLITQYLKKQNESHVTPFLGELSAWLGELRSEVKRRIQKPERRKEIYQKFLAVALEQHCIPGVEEAEQVIREEESKETGESGKEE